jgi:hypothetical protein
LTCRFRGCIVGGRRTEALQLLPRLDSNWWRDIVRETVVRSGLSRQFQVGLWLKFNELRARGVPVDFDSVGFNVYSDTNEDGILLCVLAIVGTTDRRCVDIGAGRIVGSNVANLIVNHGFQALLIDGDQGAIADTQAYYGGHPYTKVSPPVALCARVTAETVDEILTSHAFTGPLDLLCLDIDGIDYWILRAITVVQPRVLVVEYQDILGPERSCTIPYLPDFDVRSYEVNRTYYNYSGASLRAFSELLKPRGYKLVGTNRGGWNAIFVQNGLADDVLPAVSVEACFKYEWNMKGMAVRLPLVKDMHWVDV